MDKADLDQFVRLLEIQVLQKKKDELLIAMSDRELARERQLSAMIADRIRIAFPEIPS